MKLTNKIICVLFSALIIFNTTPHFAFASQNDDYYAQYTGTTRSSGYNINCTFTINEIC